MNYKPRWERIFLLAAVLNFFLLFAIYSKFFTPPPKVESVSENLIEVAWADLPDEKISASTQELIQTFPEINLPPLEIPKIEIPAPPEPVAVAKSVEPPKEILPPAEKSEDKLKVIVKVYPKDLLEQLAASGAIPEKISIDDKIILAVTVGVDGKVTQAEILQGGGTDERGTIINFVSKTAASSWIFEPYLDEDGKPQEMKTQIEFTSEDF